MDLGHSYLVAGKDTFLLSLDEDVPQDMESTSNLVIFPDPVNTFRLIPGQLADTVVICMINADLANFPHEITPQVAENKDIRGLKTLPGMVDQSVWRAGLPDPDYERIHNTVKNVIIHHSATSNLVTDYTSAIRNIYLYHTQINHWSDIGYNYVVAPDGLIYKARDPGIYLQDEVLGAHFCASNTGTLGICVLGTYSDEYPSDTSMQSLEKLIVWKLAKDHLEPLGVTAHPLNPDLDVIAGHRDGCATECPGDSLYTDLGILRNRVHEAMILLGTGYDESAYSVNDQEGIIRVYPNPAHNLISIDGTEDIVAVLITDSYGRLLMRSEGNTKPINIGFLSGGWYQLTIIQHNRIISRKILKF